MPFLFLSSPFCSALCLYMYFLSSYFFLSRMHVSYFVCVFANAIKNSYKKKPKQTKNKNPQACAVYSICILSDLTRSLRIEDFQC